MKIVTVVGARPQFIKAAAVSRAIARFNRAEILKTGTPARPALTEIIVHTGQHYDDGMSAIFFRELKVPKPHYCLEVGSGSHGWQTGQMLTKLEKVLVQENPDVVLVYGDTNSTLAGALAAAKIHIPVAHVEAGLRSFNRAMPEEINRVLTDHMSDLLFCPSQTAVDNLAREGLTEGVHVVGDVMYDALKFMADHGGGGANILEQLQVKPNSFLLATLHRAENTDNPERLFKIISALDELSRDEPVVMPLHPRTLKCLNDVGILAGKLGNSNMKIIEPVGYTTMLTLEKSARMILTDSGGMQKEAYWLGIPCITLRDETEWVETVENGWNILAGANPAQIIRSVRSFRPPPNRMPLYGDSKTAERIIEALLSL
jgi:UDP-GlcNAc3NAcA epimerase